MKYFTSEHVSPGHPDKIMDTIAEAIVNYHIAKDPRDRIAIDGVIKNNRIVLVGEITTSIFKSKEHQFDEYRNIIRNVLDWIGYNEDNSPDFNYKNFDLELTFTTQSPDIAQGVDAHERESEGAGDIGIMFGGAVNEAPDMTSHAHYLARLLSFKLFESRGEIIYPDQKTQVTIRYENDVPVEITDVVLCVSHKESISTYEIDKTILNIVNPIISEYAEKHNLICVSTKICINPTGSFSVMGPVADAGTIGRKIVCDQYGGYFPVGGGNLNGKCPTKVDRIGVYKARHLAKRLVKEGLCSKALIQVSYAIGLIDPVSLNIECFGTNKIPMEKIYSFVDFSEFRVRNIIDEFNLLSDRKNFDYTILGAYGHIGEKFDGTEIPWEEV